MRLAFLDAAYGLISDAIRIDGEDDMREELEDTTDKLGRLLGRETDWINKQDGRFNGLTNNYYELHCPWCHEKCDTDYIDDIRSDKNTKYRIWCPMCEHIYEIIDMGTRPFGLEEDE